MGLLNDAGDEAGRAAGGGREVMHAAAVSGCDTDKVLIFQSADRNRPGFGGQLMSRRQEHPKPVGPHGVDAQRRSRAALLRRTAETDVDLTRRQRRYLFAGGPVSYTHLRAHET